MLCGICGEVGALEGNGNHASCNAAYRKQIRDEEREAKKRAKALESCNRLQRNSNKDSKPNGKQKRINPVSEKRAKQVRQYNKEVKEWKKDKSCALCGAVPVDCHHQLGKENELLLDRRFWLPLCRDHHRYFTDNSREAIELGISLPRNSTTVIINDIKPYRFED